jgi:ABC-type antimicrobial peptide transport system permease subunit
VRSGKATRDLHGNVLSYNFLAALGVSTLSQFDVTSIQSTPHVAAAPLMPIIGSVTTSTHRHANDETPIIATTPDLATVMQFKVRSGEFVNTSTDGNTAVLGYNLAEQLLGADTAIGHTIYLRGQQFTVIGILAPYAIAPNFDNPFDFNTSVFIPLSAGQSFNQGIPEIQQVNIRVTDGANPATTSAAIRRQLLTNHNGEEDFTILKPSDTVAITDSLLRIVTLLTTAIASISLIVGGIGIMNIMLVSVTERTREIGIRKTVGATNTQILRQFVIEALVMSLVGGIIGVAIAYGGAYGLGMFIGFMPVVALYIIVIALVMALATGVIFGIAPAIKAARKNPIEALRFFQ